MAKNSKEQKSPGKKYLVIKHGALGDFILATGPFAAIRQRHPKSHIVLLTTRPFADLAGYSPYFDEIWIDEKPKFFEFEKWWKLIKRLRQANFRMVYDLQTSFRSCMYFRLMGRKKPLWSGIVDWCSHPHTNPERELMHTIDRQRQQLYIAGIEHVPKPDISWLSTSISRFDLAEPYALLIPGGSAHRPEKRWPAENYAKLARYLRDAGITPVLIGTAAEKDVTGEIAETCSGAIDLTDKTSFAEIAELARHAEIAIGNDTGPVHIVAAAKCLTIVLFSEFSNPALCAPVGENVQVMYEEDLDDLKEKDVISMIDDTL